MTLPVYHNETVFFCCCTFCLSNYDLRLQNILLYCPHLPICFVGEETSQLCIKLALDQAKSSSNLSSFLSSLLSPAVFIGLGVRMLYIIDFNTDYRFQYNTDRLWIKNQYDKCGMVLDSK